MSITVIRAGEGDLAGIREIEEESFSRPWSEAALRSELQNGRSALFVAKDGDKAVGWAGMTWVLDEGSVSDIAVLPACRRQGLGRALTEALLAECKSRALSCLLLEVRVSNAPAIALYRALGFREVGRRPRFYEDPREDALLMRADLSIENQTERTCLP